MKDFTFFVECWMLRVHLICKCWVLDRGEVGTVVDALVVKEFLLPGGIVVQCFMVDESVFVLSSSCKIL